MTWMQGRFEQRTRIEEYGIHWMKVLTDQSTRFQRQLWGSI